MECNYVLRVVLIDTGRLVELHVSLSQLCRTSLLCPKCDEMVSSQEVFLDKSCLRELQKLRIVCECGWVGSLEEWEV